MAQIFELFPGGKRPNYDSKNDDSKEEEQKLNGRNAALENIMKEMNKFAVTVLTPEQRIKISNLEKTINSVAGDYSQPAYDEYYNSLNESELDELLPILDNLTEADFQSRPAYARALLTVLKEKDLTAGLKKRQNNLDDNEI